MAQRRMLAKSISTSRKLNKVGDSPALLFTWTLSHLDDFGNFDGAADVIRGSIVPMRNWKLDKVQKAMEELLAIGAWVLYEVDGEPYIHCEKFDDFQTFKGDRDRISLYPKYKEELRKPLDSKWNPVDSYRLSEVKVSKDKLIKENKDEASDWNMKFFQILKENGIEIIGDPAERLRYPRNMRRKNGDVEYWISVAKFSQSYKFQDKSKNYIFPWRGPVKLSKLYYDVRTKYELEKTPEKNKKRYEEMKLKFQKVEPPPW